MTETELVSALYFVAVEVVAAGCKDDTKGEDTHVPAISEG